MDTLKDIYTGMLEENKRKKKITSSTPKIISNAADRSPNVIDLEAIVFNFSPEQIQILKTLPIKALNLFHTALNNLLNAAVDTPQLKTYLNQMIDDEFEQLEEVTPEDEFGKDKESKLGKLKKEGLDGYKDFLNTLHEKIALGQLDRLAATDANQVNVGLYNRIMKEIDIASLKGINPKNPLFKKIVQATLSTLIKDSQAANLERYLMRIINYSSEATPATEEAPAPVK